jgi:putative membrane protein insertion efficiency factor
MRNALRHLWHLPRNAIVATVRAYQRTLSLDHGPLRHHYPYGYCRHSPTCSQYAIDAVLAHGAAWGSILAMRRILTCHPWRKPDQKKVLETIERHFPKKP